MYKHIIAILALLAILPASAQQIDLAKQVKGLLPSANIATTLAGKTFTAPAVTVQACAVTSTPTWDMAAGNMCTLALSGGNITAVTVTNPPAGGTVAFKITQDSTPRTITWPSGNGTSTLKVRWPGGVAPTLTSTSGGVDVVSCAVFSQYLWSCVWQGNFQ